MSAAGPSQGANRPAARSAEGRSMSAMGCGLLACAPTSVAMSVGLACRLAFAVDPRFAGRPPRRSRTPRAKASGGDPRRAHGASNEDAARLRDVLSMPLAGCSRHSPSPRNAPQREARRVGQ
jgi:hypothetical protein